MSRSHVRVNTCMARVKVLVQQDTTGLWVAKVPQLSASVYEGGTPEEAMANALDAVSVPHELERDATSEDL